jgi:NAD(P)-dependent dehydrogenase (short-subunit alcohol dehydrogenase family)
MENKKVLVVGASGGIGSKATEVLLEDGYSVVGTFFKHKERADNLQQFGNFVAKYLDLRSVDSVIELQQSLRDEKLYAVVNCAGIARYEGKEVEEDIKIWTETVATNLSGNFYLAKIVYNNIRENGRFVMISSTDAFYGGAITASYAVSKAGANSLIKSLSLLFRGKKIRVNAIAPDWVLTPMIVDNGEDFLQKVAAINPLKRNGLPEDIAKIIYRSSVLKR